ncbi:MAG: UbiD family decarboxylase [bacterium]|nr:UbiD family decarboxylase [bacterium]
MPFHDLREFLAALEAAGDLVRVSRPVETRFEIAAGIRKMSDTGGPTLWFENVAGHDMPVVGAVFATRSKALLALGVDSAAEGNARFSHGLRNPIEPRLVPFGECQEVVHTGSDINLHRLPMPVYSEKDGGPYVTVALEVSKDPIDRKVNASVYRVMRTGSNRMSVMSHAFQGLGTHMARAGRRGESLDVAIVNGCDPVLLYASQAKVPQGVNEMTVAGGIRGEPVDVVKCVSVDLEVPSSAEIVIEGRVLPGERVMEGPFGEFTGYYGPAEENHVIEVTAITHRRDPIFLAGMTGLPPTDNHVLKSFAYESALYEKLLETFPEVTAVTYPNWGGVQYAAVIALEQRYKGQARHVILTALGDSSRPKLVIVVDEDIDVYDTEMVNWAIMTRSQPEEDTIIVPRVAGGPLDPSAPEKEVISVWGIDATRPFGVPYPEVVKVPGADDFRIKDWV